MKIKKRNIKRLALVILSAIIYTISMQVFVNSGDLFPGGFAGLAYLIIRLVKYYLQFDIPFGVVYIILNLIPTIMVFKYIGHRFTILSIIQYLLVSLFSMIIPEYRITYDPLLISVFGGILSGFAVSIALNAGASSGGVDFISIYYSNKSNRPAWWISLLFSTCVLLVAGFVFGWNIALYSIIYQFCNTQVVSLRHKRYKLMTLFIVTTKPDEVKEAIMRSVRHGVTMIDARGGFSNTKQTILMMTINAYQMDDLIRAAKKADEKVFISINNTERIVGNYYQAPMD